MSWLDPLMCNYICGALAFVEKVRLPIEFGLSMSSRSLRLWFEQSLSKSTATEIPLSVRLVLKNWKNKPLKRSGTSAKAVV